MKDRTPPLGAWPAAAIAAGVVVAAAMAGRHASPTPDHPRTMLWYARLRKPDYTPPPPAYGIAWGVIQSLLAWSGYRLIRRPASTARTWALALWGLNQAAIAGWSEIFFGQRSTSGGALAAGAMIGTAAGYVAVTAQEDEAAAAAGVPLLLWVTFATLLAEEIWRKND